MAMSPRTAAGPPPPSRGDDDGRESIPPPAMDDGDGGGWGFLQGRMHAASGPPSQNSGSGRLRKSDSVSDAAGVSATVARAGASLVAVGSALRASVRATPGVVAKLVSARQSSWDPALQPSMCADPRLAMRCRTPCRALAARRRRRVFVADAAAATSRQAVYMGPALDRLCAFALERVECSVARSQGPRRRRGAAGCAKRAGQHAVGRRWLRAPHDGRRRQEHAARWLCARQGAA